MKLPRPLPFLLSAAALATLALPATAAAQTDGTVSSTNWSGYAAHGGAAKFEQISGDWTQPTGTCTSGQRTYSAFWVGLGGYSLTSNALEQIGTELDCSTSGHSELKAWYELVPAPSRPIRMTVHAGDRIAASVRVVGKKVTLTLSDRTRHEKFERTITDHTIDISSAEWITEAPSECYSADNCAVLPLTDFGSVGFTGAQAETTTGRKGSVTARLWDTTKIVLGTSGQQFVSNGQQVEATPSALSDAGKRFSVVYDQTAEPAGSSGPAPYRVERPRGSVRLAGR